ncbi:citrate lyase holo-[acyl-carrier protein] synthase [Fusibacter ferrireducens]|uniref:citrate lyase holo-[acyl-carrier protein] synthase n=1 Tax=Fusibacter ferrireducens TaxID=2785058 RepID=A0ABR9ZZA8_9FIRM|nr:citrate lyase holo-[acyl-carrier protein] synthase [Fusibacter ferrireducens]MBF4695296.1 citrate lyase holo-[acyl-carrier protein] synthase [Fusibacter ferrireducens]
MRLETLLEYREIKADFIQMLVARDERTVLVIRANIPGPNKKSDWALKLHDEAVRCVKTSLESEDISYEEVTSDLKKRVDPAEYVDIFYVALEAKAVKALCIQIEEQHSIGRIFDLDVYNEKGQSLTRAQMNKGVRKCYLCDQPAYECGRGRVHTLSELELFLISKANAL